MPHAGDSDLTFQMGGRSTSITRSSYLVVAGVVVMVIVVGLVR